MIPLRSGIGAPRSQEGRARGCVPARACGWQRPRVVVVVAIWCWRCVGTPAVFGLIHRPPVTPPPLVFHPSHPPPDFPKRVSPSPCLVKSPIHPMSLFLIPVGVPAGSIIPNKSDTYLHLGQGLNPTSSSSPPPSLPPPPLSPFLPRPPAPPEFLPHPLPWFILHPSLPTPIQEGFVISMYTFFFLSYRSLWPLSSCSPCSSFRSLPSFIPVLVPATSIFL